MTEQPEAYQAAMPSELEQLSDHTNQAMLICKDILEEYQKHGHDFEWQKTLLPRLCNLGEYIIELIKAMDEEITAHKERAAQGGKPL